MVIGDLFGGGMNSTTKALDEEDVEIYTFYILTTFGTTNYLDLAGDIEEIIEELKKFPHPDLIFSSPPCTSFSLASAMKGGNGSYTFEDKHLAMRTLEEYEDSRYNFYTKARDSGIGQKCIFNTICIIQYFKPKAGYIENPAKSRMGKYIEYNLNYKIPYLNKVNYGDYDAPYQKPTIFASNVNMKLREQPKGKKYGLFDRISKQGISRSEIPATLLQDIYKELKNE